MARTSSNRVLFVHNDYARPSGEEHASQALADLLTSHGHEVAWYRRRSEEITGTVRGNVKAFFAALHNPWAAREVARKLDDFKPDLVQVQNIYPLLSPSVFKPCKERDIPVAMRCPNYRLFCPNGLHLSHGGVCEKCLGTGREIWCVLRNCEGSLPKSIGYALRNWAARVTKRILNGVDMFIVQSEFQKGKFVSNGIPAERIGVVPGITPEVEYTDNNEVGEFVSFVGRVSPEKGIDDLLEAARALPEIPFAVAGSFEGMPGIRERAPGNVKWMGFLSGSDLDDFYRRSRILVFPSLWYEGFPNVVTRAMIMGKPVIASKIGVFSEIIDDGKTGLLSEVGDTDGLIAVLCDLYKNPDRCRAMGEAGKRKAVTFYSSENIYERLMQIYEKAAT